MKLEKERIKMDKHKKTKTSVNYFHGRPFLVIDLHFLPKPNVKTHQKEWAKTAANWDTNETPRIVTRLNFNTIRSASVIVDIANKKLIKNRFSSSEDDVIYKTYTEKYYPQVKQAMESYENDNPSSKNNITITMPDF